MAQAQALTPKGTSTPTSGMAWPFEDFRTEIDRLFESFFSAGYLTPGLVGRMNMVVPTVDVKEDDQRILVEVELPGLDEKDVELTFKDRMLTIRGEKKAETEEKKANFHVMERRYGGFKRVLRLPETVDEDKIEASVEKGVLKVMLPKKQEAMQQEKRIAIRASGNGGQTETHG